MLSNLKILRNEVGISQKALADAIGISQQSINKYENHNIEPDIETLIQIANFFSTSIDYLVGRTDYGNHSCVHEFTKEEVRLLYNYRKLKAHQKNSLLSVIDAFLK